MPPVEGSVQCLGGHQFQSPEAIVKLIKVLGRQGHVCFRLPFGNRLPHNKTVKVACKGSRELEDLLFFKNAQRLLNLTI